jgi:CheY-like chemotaxis protein
MIVLRVLIVEDDPFVALDLEMIVQDAAEADVSVASSLAEAHDAIGQSVDFVFLDVDLSDGRAFDIAARLRERCTPFVFVTASARDETPPALADAPFIAKPYRVWQIVRALHDNTRVAQH